MPEAQGTKTSEASRPARKAVTRPGRGRVDPRGRRSREPGVGTAQEHRQEDERGRVDPRGRPSREPGVGTAQEHRQEDVRGGSPNRSGWRVQLAHVSRVRLAGPADSRDPGLTSGTGRLIESPSLVFLAMVRRGPRARATRSDLARVESPSLVVLSMVRRGPCARAARSDLGRVDPPPDHRQASSHVRTVCLKGVRMCGLPAARSSYQAATRCCMGPPRVSTNSAREPENGIFSQRPVWRRTLSPYFDPPR